jgi:site-specific DNA recombinase
VAPRAGIYARISSDDDHDALGVQRQREDCEALARRKGWEVVAVHVDNDISAADKRKDRPGFAALMAQLEGGELDDIVAADLDRLVRRPIQLEHFVDKCLDAGVRHLATVGGDVDLGTGDGLLVARIKGAVAADEIDRVRKRVRRKKDELAMAGKPSGGGARPFGFEPDGLTIREPEAEIIRELAGRVLAGESLGSLAADLDRRGIATVSGRSWVPNVLRGMLFAPRIAGLRQHRGEVVGPAAWDPILDRRTWEQLQAHFLTPARRRVGAGRRLLTGLLVCGRCGARLISGQNNGQRAYVCRKYAGFDGCGGLAMIAEPLEELITEAVLIRLDSPELAERLAGGHDDDQTDKLATLRDRLDELADSFASGEITRREWLRAREGIEARIADAQRTLRRSSTAAALDLGNEPVRDAWAGLALERQRAALAAVVERVTIGPAVRGRNRFDPERVDMTWRA